MRRETIKQKTFTVKIQKFESHADCAAISRATLLT